MNLGHSYQHALLFIVNVAISCLVFCATSCADHPNVLLICVDDLRPELNCYGKDYISSPHIDGLAKTGMQFDRHYVHAPTCGASRFVLLTGLYGSNNNGALFQRAKSIANSKSQTKPSLPKWFRDQGYTTVSIGKVSHHPGGRGGPNWDDDSIPEMPESWDRHLLPSGSWQHPRGVMHGLANGEIRKKAEEMDLFQSVAGADEIYPDGLIANTALEQLDELSATAKQPENSKPFFLAVGIIRPHLPLGAPAKYFSHYENAKLPEIPHPKKPNWKSTWHKSGEFMKYNRWGKNPNVDGEFATQVRKHYAACVSYADAQVGKLLQRLDELEIADDTIVVLWGDHGWHLGEHAVWGKHTLFEESLHSPLIIRYPKMKSAGTKTKAVVGSVDLFPTLAELAGLKAPEFAEGVSLKPILENPQSNGHPVIGYYGKSKTIRNERYRMILHRDGWVELYDLQPNQQEVINVADQFPDVVEQLKAKLLAVRGD